MYKKISISETELQVMTVLWNSQTPKTLTELLNYFYTEQGKDWKQQTLLTFLSRLEKKGLVSWEQNGRARSYKAAVSPKEYESLKAKGILDTLYRGSIKKFMTALFDGNALSQEEIDELKQWLSDK